MTVEVVLDASALAASLHDEPGAARVDALIEYAAISTVNLGEALQASIRRGHAVDGLVGELEAYGLVIEPFTAGDAEIAAALWTLTRAAGLSFGDRSCLALASRLGVPVLTTDRAWAKVDVGVPIELIR